MRGDLVQFGWVGVAAWVALASACSDSDKTGTSDGRDADTEAEVEDTTGDTADTTPDTDVVDSTAADSDTTPEPGAFGAPCTENKNCNSGWCVSSPLGPLCTRTCEEDCPNGWSCLGITDQLDVTFLCVPSNNRLCQPCTVDTQCGSGYCLTRQDGLRCSTSCRSNSECPSGYSCKMTESESLSDRRTMQCIPDNDTCECLPGQEGLQRPCKNENESGTCWGLETCQGAQGWSTCDAQVPSAEVCDGVDNNCNLLVDEGVTAPEAACAVTNEVGTCGAPWTCQGAAGWVCLARTPVAEACNGVDDDCDLAIDEDFKDEAGRYASADNCGACGLSCAGAIPNATATCRISGANARCEVGACDPGYYAASVLTCLPATSSLCLACSADANCPTPGDKCVPLDGTQVCGQDCSDGNAYGTAAGVCPEGNICRDFGGGVRQCVPASGSCTCLEGDAGKTRNCLATNAAGTCFGTATCDPESGWSQCNARRPTLEVCNGADDDCNALTDDVPGRGAACAITNAFGTCAGVEDCAQGSEALTCVGKTPAAEVCNYADDDCDGATDEGFPNLNQSCSSGAGACQRFGFNVCTANGQGTQCNAVAAQPGTEICDNIDNDCDGQTDEGAAFAQKGQPCTSGQGVCQVTGVFQCAGNGQSVACSQTPPAPAVQTEAGRCNGLDDDCDGSVDEDFPNKGQVCSVGTGVCRAFGNFVCAGNGAGTTCNAVAGAGSAESCDLLDNNCDGSTDEAFKNGQGKYALDTTCGNCFTDCRAILNKPNAYGVCDAAPAVPGCKLQCCRAGDTNAACDGGDWYDLNGVPDDGCELKLDPDAIYVSTSDTGAINQQGCGRGPRGTGANGANYPCKTITYGLTEAARVGVNRGKVLVADGLYVESVTLVGGKQVLGGYRADTWERNVAATNTSVRGPTVVSGHSKTIIADGITTATVFEGFIVYGGTTFATGQNSYAFWLRGSNQNLQIKNNIVFGGNGGDGEAGAAGVGGSNGGNGQVGERAIRTTSFDSCETQPNQPGNVPQCFDNTDNLVASACGAGGANTCGGESVAGGAGRGSICPSNNTQQGSGTAGSAAANGGTAGVGGAGGYDRVSTDCGFFGTGGFNATAATGTNGGRGEDREGGVGCSAVAGTITNNEWVGNSGSDGLSGRSGGGGGGGGAGGGADVTINCNDGDSTRDSLGGSGGGGGAGGCGGTAGAGGKAGGGAFVFFITNNAQTAAANLPTITSNTVTRGTGGKGGNGGIGGKGGRGGDGGAGGAVSGRFAFAMGQGGRGGQGGDGGHGGGGGGGCGGVSFGVYVHNFSGSPTYHTGNTFVVSGAGGAGGGGGASPGSAGGAGTAGTSADRNY